MVLCIGGPRDEPGVRLCCGWSFAIIILMTLRTIADQRLDMVAGRSHGSKKGRSCKSGLSPYRRGARAASESDLFTRQFIRSVGVGVDGSNDLMTYLSWCAIGCLIDRTSSIVVIVGVVWSCPLLVGFVHGTF
ncbi:hypothetical protein HAX54_024062 [Datura stramonium]|uniref:Uncharacterized protein n=1 Tax=Datura stramonium TaxID=4076 RepID=A0ABS8UXF0_DATST|nr:hypothetical protein [Datura stramonium]